ncbi:MAG: hypothetical protein NTW30_03365 [Candidatus Aenigmarchaeota archaeon]|nr:hypothetical protein [Candidatus Aenigmarchaeota archaeon]
MQSKNITTNLTTYVDLAQFSFILKYDPSLFTVKESDLSIIATDTTKNKIIVSVDSKIGQIVLSVSDLMGGPIVKRGEMSLYRVGFTSLSSNVQKMPNVNIQNISAYDTALNRISFIIIDDRNTIMMKQL